MAKKVEETHSSISSESSPPPTTPPMASLLRRVRVFFNRISGFTINSSETNQSPRSSSSRQQPKNFPQGCRTRRVPVCKQPLSLIILQCLCRSPRHHDTNSSSEILILVNGFMQVMLAILIGMLTLVDMAFYKGLHSKITRKFSLWPSLYEVMRDVTWALFASRKALNAITINYRNGFVQAFHRDHRSNNTFYIYSDLVNYSISGSYDINLLSSHQGWSDQSIHNNFSAIWYREPLDPLTGEKIGKARPILPDDLINIAGLSQVPDGVSFVARSSEQIHGFTIAFCSVAGLGCFQQKHSGGCGRYNLRFIA
ncbi:hypothetical protein HYC85_002121 [Camellia sinensis]|uniref:histidine kinase n=1 Tax=Camellia sinensis TaxID=4442 RepID=A0A7J7I7B0_CAMSI|nr:hypothetical protein HYC85_002121 [Camellia sinensis]